MQKVLITGSNGMLGMDIVKVLQEQYLLYGIDKSINDNGKIKQFSFDLTDSELLKSELKNFSADFVILCAANVSVDDCEKNRNNAFKLHVESTDIISSSLKNSKFIYISTDSVYDGNKGGYSEQDNTNPLNYYAITKLEGERALLKNKPDSVIIRTNIIGCSNPMKSSITEWAIKNLSDNKKINGFFDVFFNPVYTKHLAQIILDIINSDLKGIINIAGSKMTNKYDFLIELAGIFNFSTDLVQRTSVKEFSFNAPRPLNTTLNTKKYYSFFNKRIPDFIEGLTEIKAEYLKHIPNYD